MKIKSDFVTNSSSSSFIVFFPQLIETLDDALKYISRLDHAKTIFSDIKKQTPYLMNLNNESVLNDLPSIITNGFSDIRPYNYEDIFCQKHKISKKEFWDNSVWRRQCFEEEEIVVREKSIIKIRELCKQYEGHYAYIFEFSDNDGEYFSYLEHEYNWNGLPFIRVNNH